MKSIINNLYFGKIFPFEQIVSRDEEYRAVNRKIGDEKQYFKSILSPDNAARFEALENLYSDANCLQEAETFSQGFRLGAQLMMEILSNASDKTD